MALARVALLVGAASGAAAHAPQPKALLQVDDKSGNPIQRVVGLLKEMQTTIESEQAEDKDLYKKLKCWCNDNNWEKGNAVEASENKISELEATIKELTARSSELNTNIKDLNAGVAANTQALNEAKALRAKQLKEFHGYELDAIQNVENLKAALVILSKHEGGVAYGQGGEDSFGKSSDSWSLLAINSKTKKSKKQEPMWTEQHEASHMDQPLDAYLTREGFDGKNYDAPVAGAGFARGGFLQQTASAQAKEAAVVDKAIKTMNAFAQLHQGEGYMPGYSSQSGEILGIMKQMMEELKADLNEEQTTERSRVEEFNSLRAAKTTEIEDGEKMAETKEDELADTDNALAEAKEDLGVEQKLLAENQEFLKNMGETCAEAKTNFETRTQARADEAKAVSETIEILTSDEARDNQAATYGFVQVSMHKVSQRRSQAATVLRMAATKSHSPMLSMLATSAELDSFTKVKKAIDDLIATLKTQQEDEVKKNNWCKSELQSNEMTTLKTEDHKGDLDVHKAKLESDIEALAKRIEEAVAEVAELRVNLQRANENRKVENMDFQKTVGDQIMTVEILKKALDKLANYYDLLQQRQAPPVAQGEYKKSAGAEGVMQMIEKLVGEAQAMTKEARKDEGEAQAAYEAFIAETNTNVATLEQEIATKTQTKAKTIEHRIQTEGDIADTMSELEGLSKYNGELHKECDYLLKNFDVRQQARSDETESLQQAKQILSGAAA